MDELRKPTPNPTSAALQIWRGEHRGKLVWWRLSLNHSHENDSFGVEMIDTNGDYRRTRIGQLDLRTLPSLRDEIVNIVGAPSVVLNDEQWWAWCEILEPSHTFLSRNRQALGDIVSP